MFYFALGEGVAECLSIIGNIVEKGLDLLQIWICLGGPSDGESDVSQISGEVDAFFQAPGLTLLVSRLMG